MPMYADGPQAYLYNSENCWVTGVAGGSAGCSGLGLRGRSSILNFGWLRLVGRFRRRVMDGRPVAGR